MRLSCVEIKDYFDALPSCFKCCTAQLLLIKDWAHMHHLHADVSDIHASMKHFKCGDGIKKLICCRTVFDFYTCRMVTQYYIVLVFAIRCKRKFHQLALPYLEVLWCVGRHCMSSEVLGALSEIASLPLLLGGVGFDTLQRPLLGLLYIYKCISVNVNANS